MGRFFNPDNSAFQTALNSEIYIDKTGLIAYTNKVINTRQAFVCNSRPRRFGKSITADMLTAYYSKGCDSETMFSGLKISSMDSFRANLNKYNVLHLDMQWFLQPDGDTNEIVSVLQKSVIKELKTAYPDILNDDVTGLPDALSLITEKSGSKFIVIVDEWDVLIRDEAANQKVQDEYIGLLRRMFKGTEPTKFIALAYLTGILPIKRLKTQSALNNFMQFTMLSPGPLAEYVGFTEEEVHALCDQYHQDFTEVKRWYDGYQLGKYHVYNPNAVVNLMVDGTFQSYWSQTGTFESIRPFINMDFDGLKTAIIEMISGTDVEVYTAAFQNDMVSFESKDDVLTLLIHLGYLAYNQTNRTAFIPNEEIRQEFISATKSKKWNELIEFERQSKELLNATLDGNEEKVSAGIEKIHTEFTSSIQYNDENSLSSVLTIAYLSAMQYYFKPIREFPTGRGFADFVFIPKPEYVMDYPALLIELKWNRNAKTALQQIKEKHYPESLVHYTDNILLVAINYDKKSKTHQCKIEEYRE
ncbi:MAG: AAA family ATPase [Candidatus Limivivens sp.]|nr:AAA family ATPase [Candidatus Limivivens sp.]